MVTLKTRIAIVDDHPVVRRGIRETLAESDDFEVCAEGNSADEAQAIAERHTPDMMVIDANMPGGSGISALQAIGIIHPRCKGVILSVNEDKGTVEAAMHAGAWGYIAKGIGGADLLEALRRVRAGQRYIDPVLAAQILSPAVRPKPSSAAPGGEIPMHILSDREKQILKCLGEGLSNAEICTALSLRENTVKHYMTPLFKKLGVKTRIEVTMLVRGNS